jgi:large subunit ribosomal protein L15
MLSVLHRARSAAASAGPAAGVLRLAKREFAQRFPYASPFAEEGPYVPLKLNTIAPNPGATSQKRRVGRGIGSGRGKTCKRGHKGTRARSGGSVSLGFEGGQTPMHRRLPKRGFKNGPDTSFDTVSLEKIHEYIAMGRLRVPSAELITMKHLQDAGVINKIKHGLKLLGGDSRAGKGVPEQFTRIPLHLEVCGASSSAVAAVEAVGGTVTCAHFNRLALQALLKPHKFELLPRRARPPPRLMPRFLDYERRGYLSPEVQMRNLRLFGHVTSEKRSDSGLPLITPRHELQQEAHAQ